MGRWFMQGMQQPSLNLAHLALLPKQPLQRSFPVLQSARSQPRTGTVTWSTPPVQPSQQPPSTTAKGVYSTATLQRGRWRDLAEVIQTRGSCLSQVWSPSKGLQLLQENLPAQLLLQFGQTVAWKVRPFLTGFRLNEFTLEIPPELLAWTEAINSSTVSANPMAFINLSTNYYSEQKITADQQFLYHFQKNTRIGMPDLPAFFVVKKFFQKTFWVKITKEISSNKRRTLRGHGWDEATKRLWIKVYQEIFMNICVIKGFQRADLDSYMLDEQVLCFILVLSLYFKELEINIKRMMCFISVVQYKVFSDAIFAYFNPKLQCQF